MLTDASLSWLEIFLRVGFALCAGTIIGLEREISNHPAGMRTHALVRHRCCAQLYDNLSDGL